MKRTLARLAAMVIGAGVATVETEALANCKVGEAETPCATQNGHYRIRLPGGTGPHPAVLYLYGSTGNSAEKLASEGFVRSFIDRGYAVIVPAALDKLYVGGLLASGWALRNTRARPKRNDSRFVAEVLDDATVRHNLDRNRVMIAGMSDGGFLTWEIACHEPNMAAAYAAIGSAYLGPMPERCAAPVRMLHMHGTQDRIVPLRPSKPWRSGGTAMTPAETALSRVAGTSGCVEAGAPTELGVFTRTAWTGCAPGSAVELLTHKGGHTIPLSWYSLALDWFEGKLQGSTAPGTPATVRAPGSDATPAARPRFQRAGDDPAEDSRFKRIRLTQ